MQKSIVLLMTIKFELLTKYFTTLKVQNITMSDNTHAIDSRSENQDLVFKISKVDGILLNYFGSKHFLPKNSTEKIIGRSLYSIIRN